MNYKDILDMVEAHLVGEAHLDELASKTQDPYTILISTILSARTKDENTKQATTSLFSKYKTPQEIADARVEDLERLVYKAGFYRVKAARIKEVSRIIVDDYGGKVPQDYEELKNLPGVGSKTANCVLVYAFKIPAIPVDTHVHRISNRLRWVLTKNPEQTEKKLQQIIPKGEWIRINRLLVRFGQEICVPINPKCDICPITNNCPKDFSRELSKNTSKVDEQD
jgi:endonuclease-3